MALRINLPLIASIPQCSTFISLVIFRFLSSKLTLFFLTRLLSLIHGKQTTKKLLTYIPFALRLTPLPPFTRTTFSHWNRANMYVEIKIKQWNCMMNWQHIAKYSRQTESASCGYPFAYCWSKIQLFGMLSLWKLCPILLITKIIIIIIIKKQPTLGRECFALLGYNIAEKLTVMILQSWS
jgi:hypothetical protein